MSEFTKRYFEEFSGVTTRKDKRQKTRKMVMQIKTGKPCMDCKEIFPHYIMEFDHVRGSKIGNIESIARIGDMEMLMEEISKCDLICSNCHKHRTFMRSAGSPRRVN